MSQFTVTSRSLLATIACSAALAGCSPMSSMKASDERASARLAATAGNTATGTVAFVARGDRLEVSGQFSGLKPNAAHGLHVHEKGDCSAPDATSAGGHFDVAGQPHGNPAGGAHHAGDLPSLMSDADGKARLTFQTSTLALTGPASVVGRAVVIHRDPDDFRSQPAGNSGPRIACGVVARG